MHEKVEAVLFLLETWLFLNVVSGGQLKPINRREIASNLNLRVDGFGGNERISKMTELKLPSGYHQLLTDFIFTVLQDKPEDIVNYAARYFEILRDSEAGEQYREMNSHKENDNKSDDEEFVPPPTKPRSRRAAVAAESYDPTKENDVEIISYPKTEKQLNFLEKAVKDILLFKSVNKKQLTLVLSSFFHREVEENELIIKQGDDGDNFYVVETGIYDIFIENGDERKKIATIDGKGSFGELALMYNCPRAATIIAVSKGTLWCLDQKVFRAIVVTAAAKQRQRFEELLIKVPMLEDLTAYERMNLADALDVKNIAAGKCIIREGDEAQNMYFIMEGKVKISVKPDKSKIEERTIAYAKDGEYFGELALVLNKPRVASVYAEGDVTLAVLDIAAFERLLGPCVEIMKRNIDVYEKERERLGLQGIK